MTGMAKSACFQFNSEEVRGGHLLCHLLYTAGCLRTPQSVHTAVREIAGDFLYLDSSAYLVSLHYCFCYPRIVAL